MATSNINPKNPPSLKDSSSFETWEKLVELWQAVTELKVEKQGPALVLALPPKAREAVLELQMSEIKGTTGVQLIIEKLATIYKKDKVDSAYEAFENFIYFKRKSDVKMADFISEFERRHVKAKTHGCELSSSVLGFFLLNQAQLEEEKKQLIKATLTKLDYEEMEGKLMKVFGTAKTMESVDECQVKVENINLTEEDVYYGQNYYRGNSTQRGPRAGRFSRGSFVNRGSRQNQGSSGYQRNQETETRSGFRGRGNGWNNRQMKCNICESTYHLMKNCPERIYYHEEYEEEEEEHDVILYQSHLLTEDDFKIFVAEASVAAILDSGASANVAGNEWYESYCKGLSNTDQKAITQESSSSQFKFGSGQKFGSMFKAVVPAVIGGKKIKISTDVIDADIPLLLSKDAMKKAETEINFVTDKVKMFGQEQEVIITNSGHYAVALNNGGDILRSIDNKVGVKVNLYTEEVEKKKIALKLHAQFAHAPTSKIAKLLERAGRGDDEELLRCIDEVQRKCKICKVYSKPPPRPVVGLPHATRLNETVAMDLFFYNG